jgi:ribokinase
MITVVGSLRLDHEVPVPQHPDPGATVLGGRVLRRLGGRGAAQAVAAARQSGPGQRVAMVGRVGQDLDGSRLRSELRAEGVDTGWVLPTPEAATGQAMIAVHEEHGGRTGVVSSGANAYLAPEDCAAAGALLRDATVTLLQMEVPDETVAAAARLAGGTVLLNPAPLLRPLPEDVLHMVDVFVPNRAELAALVGEDLPDLHAVADAARALRGPGAVVVTLGADGAVLSEDGAVLFVPPARVEAVDTASAGDAFCGALACGLAEGEPLHEAVRVACAAAGVAVSRRGATTALPTRAETDHFLKTGEV